MHKFTLTVAAGFALAVLYFAISTHFTLKDVAELLSNRTKTTDVNIRTWSKLTMEITITSVSKSKTKTVLIEASSEIEFRQKAELAVAICNERWGCTDCTWTV